MCDEDDGDGPGDGPGDDAEADYYEHLFGGPEDKPFDDGPAPSFLAPGDYEDEDEGYNEYLRMFAKNSGLAAAAVENIASTPNEESALRSWAGAIPVSPKLYPHVRSFAQPDEAKRFKAWVAKGEARSIVQLVDLGGRHEVRYASDSKKPWSDSRRNARYPAAEINFLIEAYLCWAPLHHLGASVERPAEAVASLFKRRGFRRIKRDPDFAPYRIDQDAAFEVCRRIVDKSPWDVDALVEADVIRRPPDADPKTRRTGNR